MPPRRVGFDEHDREGRLITVEFPDFFIVNVYTPNSQAELARLNYRLSWDEAYRAHLKKLEKKKPVIACGDLKPDTDAGQLVYEMYGLILALHHDARFLRRPGSVDRAKIGFERLMADYQVPAK